MKITSKILGMFFFILMVAGCYLGGPSDNTGSLSLNMIGQEVAGGYSGGIIRARLYLDGGVALTPVDVDPIIYEYQGFEYPTSTYYTIDSILPAVPINGGEPYEDFPYDGESSSGDFTIDGILPDVRYRLILEILDVYPGEAINPTQWAGISGSFTVPSGLNASVNVEMSYFSSGNTN
ncbi:hypothetical protein [Marispirochaeta aestuarii]|uniref:hypothetical protein n=1 Tax=Marispirochaeta aestuarii TaxID=1963862 RepID=UPI0029C7F961|nr:hypothetical protein [Marispirochaeta aestuarii]